MRSLFGLLLAISSLVSIGCTRANNEFRASQFDLLASAGGSSGGGSSGGTGMAGGGGGGGGSTSGEDLAVVHDLSVESPDMVESPPGIKCGGTTCATSSKDVCCITATSEMCIDINMTCGTGGAVFSCDGPEDCEIAGEACCASATAVPKGAMCGGATPACIPLCHTLTDCGVGWTACCPLADTPYNRCSRTACK